MTYSPVDTIVAIASGPGGAARGVVRIAGNDAALVARALLDDPAWPGGQQPHGIRPEVFRCRVRLPGWSTAIPTQVYYWPTARSYAAQPTVELHTLGAEPVLAAVLRACVAHGARPATPGEFTLRAFLAGRIDLLQAEAVLGVIQAAGPSALRTALAQLAGGMSEPLAQLRGQLLDLLAELEAGLDFAEEDLELLTRPAMTATLRGALDRVERLIDRTKGRASYDSPPQVVLVGSPNVGKSSLFNRLVTSGRALVSRWPGTTRDAVLGELSIDAEQPCLLVDLAGLESCDEGAHDPRALAQSVVAQRRQQASLELLCFDSSREPTASEYARLAEVDEARQLVLWTKADLPVRHTPTVGVVVSSHSGAGLDELRREVSCRLSVGRPEFACVASTAERCLASLRQARAALSGALQTCADLGGDELVAADVRAALDALADVAGQVVTDDVLDRVFSRFCIGK